MTVRRYFRSLKCQAICIETLINEVVPLYFQDTFYQSRRLKRLRNMWETSFRAQMGKRGSSLMNSSADGRRLKDRQQIPQVFSFSKNLFHHQVRNKFHSDRLHKRNYSKKGLRCSETTLIKVIFKKIFQMHKI